MMYSILGTYRTLDSSKWNKNQEFPESIYSNWLTVMPQAPQKHKQGNYENNGQSWCFWFDDDNTRSSKCILSII